MTYTDSPEQKYAFRSWRQVVLDAVDAWRNEFPNVGACHEQWASEWIKTYYEENMPVEIIESMKFRDPLGAFAADVRAQL